jgi:DNA processing protein
MTVYWLWLLMVLGAGNHKLWKLMEHCDTPEELYTELRTKDTLTGLNEREKRGVRNVTLEQASEMMQVCEKKEISIVCFDAPDYPAQLRHIYNPPCVLFYQGRLSLLRDYPALTVVGTRKPSDYSKNTGDVLCRCLAKSGLLLVSGFAIGMDSIAHRAALASGKETVAVMGCGLDVPYPKENAPAKKVLRKKGLMLSEFLPGTEPKNWNFPMRNRILSGVSSGTLVIQAPVGSGALITAEMAMEQGKPVFCIPPADIFDKQYAGVVKYLRAGAIPVFAPEDILDTYCHNGNQELEPFPIEDVLQQQNKSTVPKPAKPRKKKKEKSEKKRTEPSIQAVETQPVATVDHSMLETLEDLPKQIMALLLEQQSPMQINEIVQKLQGDLEDVAAALTELIVAQLIERLPGQYYGIL